MPHAVVQHPHNDEPTLIAGGQLLEHIIPGGHKDSAVVALQGLVQREVARAPLACRDGSCLTAGGAFQAQHLQAA
eukprot:scaffold149709_cov17-Tisochrysis_lutea.AAC.1